MADTAATSALINGIPSKTSKKKAGFGVGKKVANHPQYNEMVKQAVQALKERGGSSRQAILKYIMTNFDVGTDNKMINAHLKMALRNGVKNGFLKQPKGVGASGSFKMSDNNKTQKTGKAKTSKTTPVTSPVKKVVKAAKPAGEKIMPKTATATTVTNKTKSPKKPTKSKSSTKLTKSKSPTKPKTKKSPKKPVTSKSPKKPTASKPASKPKVLMQAAGTKKSN